MSKLNGNGLNATEERAVSLMLSGKSVTEVANALSVDRSTLYSWMDKPTFQAYHNRLVKDIRENTKQSLLSLYNDALKVIKESLNSKDERIKTKSAFWLVNRIEPTQFGETGPREVIRQQCTSPMLTDWSTSFDETALQTVM